MGMTTAARLGAGLLTFSVLARTLGPESFGILMLWMSVAALLATITNFGLTTYVLREIGANPKSAEQIINEGLSGQLLLAALVSSGAAAAAWGLNLEHASIFLLVLFATFADSVTEFLNAGFRARNRFEIETKIATVGAVFHAVIVCGAILMEGSVEVAAKAYLASRMFILALTFQAVSKYFSRPKISRFRDAAARLRGALAYAVDGALQSLFGQLDSLVLNHYIGPVAVGIYQAGMRIFQTGTQVVTATSNMFLTRASANFESIDTFTKEARRIQIVFISTGAVLGLFIGVFSSYIVRLLFGADFLPVAVLLPLFGLLFYLRFVAGAWGIVLTACGQQVFRAATTGVYWLVILALAVWLVPSYGIRGWLTALCIGTIGLILFYAVRASRYLTTSWDLAAATILCGLLFLPLLWRSLNVGEH